MADEMISLLIVDDIPTTRENLQKLLSFEDDIKVVGAAADGREAIEIAIRLKPDIILMDVNMPTMDGIRATEELAHEVPTAPVIIMSVQGERDYLRRAMQAGAREFLIKPTSHDELVSAIRRVYQLEQKKGTYAARALADANRPAVLEQAALHSGPGDVYLVFSGKGGVGKTLVAANLAVALAAQTHQRVALVDLDLQFGDIGVTLNIDHSQSITNLVDAAESLDAEVLDEVLATGPRGVRVLLAPLSPELADLVTADHVRSVMAELRRNYDIIVVDSSSHLAEFNLEVIEMAQKVLVVTTPTIPSIKDAKLTFKILESLNVEPGSLALVINRTDSIEVVNREAIEASLHYPVAIQMAHEPKVVADSIKQGAAFVELYPDAEVSRAIRDLAAQLVPIEAGSDKGGKGGKDDKKRRKGRFGR